MPDLPAPSLPPETSPEPDHERVSRRGKRSRTRVYVGLGALIVVGTMFLAPSLYQSSDEPSPTNLPFDVSAYPRGALAGQPAPDMSVEIFGGSEFILSEFRATDGRPMVLNLWAGWCAPCRIEIPEFSQVALDHPEVAFLGVAVEDNLVRAQSFAAEVGASFPLGFDTNLHVKDNYPFIGLPTTFLIDADGLITRQVNGQINAEFLETFIEHDF
ncbi:MAG: TlpA family protein disulfide reductase [Acidimicrobiia bacterium]|nr:TlpA family protein disulfide reductase [Acidimicrobiia bacterium]